MIKNVKKKILAVILISLSSFIAITLLTYRNKPEKSISYLKIGILGPLNSLSPVESSRQACNFILNLIYEPLVKFYPVEGVKPLLVSSWGNPSKYRWRFTLKKDIFFQNGKKLTPEDVVYTIKTYKRDSRINLSSIKNVEKFGKRNIIINTLYSDPDIILKLSHIYIIPYNSENKIKSNPVGTGKYRFKKWKNLSELTLEKNPGGSNQAGYPEKVDFKIYKSSKKLIKDFLENKIDIGCLSNVSKINIKSSGDKKITIIPSISNIFLSIHLNEKKFSQSDVIYLRDIISINIDRERISRAFNGFIEPTFSPTSEFLYYFDTKREYSPELKGKKPGVKNFTIYSERDLMQIAQKIKENLRKIGINLTILPISAFSYSKEKNYFVLFSYNFSRNGIFSFFLDLCLKKVRGNFIKFGEKNFSNFQDPEMLKLINSYLLKMNYNKFLKKACKIFISRYPYIPLFKRNFVLMYNKKASKTNLINY